MVSGRDADRMQSALKAMEGLAGRVVGLAADAAKREDADRLVDAARQGVGRLDGGVNNAGITRDTPLIRMKDDDWDQGMGGNLRGAVLMTRAAAETVVGERRGGL